MSLVINVATDEQGVVVSVEGEVDVSNAPELRAALEQAVEQAASLPQPQVRIDLSQVSYIDSTGIGVLVGAAHRSGELGVTVSLERLQRNVIRVLTMLGLDTLLNIHTDAE